MFETGHKNSQLLSAVACAAAGSRRQQVSSTEHRTLASSRIFSSVLCLRMHIAVKCHYICMYVGQEPPKGSSLTASSGLWPATAATLQTHHEPDGTCRIRNNENNNSISKTHSNCSVKGKMEPVPCGNLKTERAVVSLPFCLHCGYSGALPSTTAFV